MNATQMTNDTKWLMIHNSPECGKSSGIVFGTLDKSGKESAKMVMAHRVQKDKECFYVRDCEMARKLFEGFFAETEQTF